jgi:UDP-N-acetylmuramoylalanine--D-glutamate ligase
MKIAVLGYGKEGKSTYEYLKKQWYKNIDILDKSISDNYLKNLQQYDIIYKTPWISIYLPELQKVRDKIKTQADILFENYKWKLVLISWSKWKSTTSTLIFEIFKNAWKNVKLVWNIWNPILSEVDFDNQPDYIVFEISSYMLDSTAYIWSDYSILTNIYDVHTSWHQTHKNYVNAKLKMFDNTKKAILRKDVYENLNYKFNSEVILFWEWTEFYFDEKYIYWVNYKLDIKKIKLWWNHNYLNISSILPICKFENISQEVVENTLENFSGLEHRQEYVGEFDGVKYYNDSIATIPESVLQALNRFWDEIDTIILWWKDDNFDYLKVIEVINTLKLKNVVLLPDSLEKQKDLFKNKNIFDVNSMQEVVKIAKKNTQKWKICILSPWAPSYNLFKNFEQRWNLFKELVKE